MMQIDRQCIKHLLRQKMKEAQALRLQGWGLFLVTCITFVRESHRSFKSVSSFFETTTGLDKINVE